MRSPEHTGRTPLLTAGLLLVVIGLAGYVYAEVPATTQRALPPLQMLTDTQLGWVLALAGTAAVAASLCVRTVGLGYLIVVATFGAMGAWFALGWAVAHEPRAMASAALYGWITGAVLYASRRRQRVQ